MSVETILIAHDGSAGAAEALTWAVGLAQQTGARLVAVHAWSALDDLGKHPGAADLTRLHDEALAELRDTWCRDATAAGIPVDARIVEDRPVEAIVRAAREVGADVVVCGTRGRGRVAELVLGSVAQALPERADVPVVIVPHTEG
jgi:nucleotide-binding universal stress UspA family protein